MVARVGSRLVSQFGLFGVGEGIGIGIRKGDDELKARLNKAIKAIRANGTYQKINEKYFAFDVYGAE